MINELASPLISCPILISQWMNSAMQTLWETLFGFFLKEYRREGKSGDRLTHGYFRKPNSFWLNPNQPPHPVCSVLFASDGRQGGDPQTNQAGANWSVTSVLPSQNTTALWSVLVRFFFPFFSHACTDNNLSQLVDLNFLVCLICLQKLLISFAALRSYFSFFPVCPGCLFSQARGLCFCLHDSNHLGNNVYIPELLTRHRKLGGNILSHITSIASWLGWERKWEYWNSAKETVLMVLMPSVEQSNSELGKKKVPSFLTQAIRWAFWK